ncbi:hypothetical protein A6V39_00810 [Candidatus Mycoplasma haematobovis]|uniref:Uncharacterized protein n=1 Tax=Candidatus Mycoplasma haematobovis TaxID=432608 RepID=A0A1A9QDC3_9MOLU|nr:hypothetical protein [Candidatus Mycoplasma haematobovis]OAL10592.1 hypothetical protein A6V39_00810 [Candidatus Mycoplasma haematobovis]
MLSNLSATSKILIGGTTFGVISGGATLGSYLHTSKITISYRLTSEGFSLDVGDGWDEIVKAHNQAKSPNIFENKEVTNKDATWLKQKCKDTLSKHKSDNTNYQLAQRWCVKNENIESILKRAGYEPLNTEDSRIDRENWIRKIELLREENPPVTKLTTDVSNSNEDTNIVAIKKACKELNNTKTIDEGFIEKLKQAKYWCSVR